MAATEDLQGFLLDDERLPSLSDEIAEATLDTLVHVVAAIAAYKTPEDMVRYLRDGFPAEVLAGLERPYEREEMRAHVTVLLSVLEGGAA